MSRIFISYRRADSITATGRIHDRLLGAFGPENTFKDVDSIPLGTDFRTVLEETLNKVDVVLVIVGPTWAKITDDEGNQRLHDPEDFVRIEVEQALSRPEVLVIPVLVRGAPMPDTALLPASIQDLVFRNAAVVRDDPDFHRDMDQLIEKLADYFRQHGEDITLPDYATVGSSSNPSFGRRTQLSATVPAQQQQARGGALVGGVIVLLLVAGAGWLFLFGPLSTANDPEPTALAAAVTEDATATADATDHPATATSTNRPATDVPSEVPTTDIPPTATDIPPTATERPPTATDIPPTAPTAGFGDWRDDFTEEPYTTIVRASVRSCATSNCQLFVVLNPGAEVLVYDIVVGEPVVGNAEWYLVAYEDQEAYIHSGAAEPGGDDAPTTADETDSALAEGASYRITTRANVRTCPSANCSLIAALTPGVTVNVIRTEIGQPVGGNAEWYEITFEDETGFIHSGAATPAN